MDATEMGTLAAAIAALLGLFVSAFKGARDHGRVLQRVDVLEKIADNNRQRLACVEHDTTEMSTDIKYIQKQIDDGFNRLSEEIRRQYRNE